MIKNVVYIDEEERARNLYSRRLQQHFTDDIKIIPMAPHQDIDAMVNTIEQQENLASIIVDQKLNAAGTASYIGTELVEKLRLVDKQIPIYILTNYVGDIDGSLGNIEYVLNKDDLQDKNKIKSITQRITRHINTFNHILNDRELRFEELLRKRFESNLSEEETNEFSSLKYSREKKSLASTFIEGDELAKKIDIAEAKLLEIENKIK